MRQCQDRAVREAFPKLRRLPKVIGDQDGLAMARHQRVHGSKERCGCHGSEYRRGIASGDRSEFLGHAAVKPVLYPDDGFHEWRAAYPVV